MEDTVRFRGRPPFERKPFQLRLDAETFDALKAHQEAVGYTSMSEAARDLIVQAMSADPEASLRQRATAQTVAEIRKWAFKRLSESLTEMLEELKPWG